MNREFFSVLTVLCMLLTSSLAITYYHQSITKIVLCFDDAFASQYYVAFPILEKHSMKGVLYVPTASVGLEDHLSWNQIKEMYNVGWEVGSHSVNHLNLTIQPENILIYELSESKNILRQHGIYVRSFAVPYKLSNETVQRWIRKFYDFDRIACNFIGPDLDWKDALNHIEHNKGRVLLFGFHDIAEQPFKNFISWLEEKRLKGEVQIFTLSQIYDAETAQIFSNIICVLCIGSLPILYKVSPVLKNKKLKL